MACQKQLNDRPIIGIMSQESPDSYAKLGPTVVLASYVKFVESGGARVVLVKINQSHDYYTHLFKSINGLLLPGGYQSDFLNSGYGKAAKIFFDLAVEGMMTHGDYFPIWGTCMGHELLALIVAKHKDVLITGVDADNLALPLELTSDFVKSRIFDVLKTPGYVLQAMTTEDTTFNAHTWAITPKTFTKFGLDKFFRVTSVNKDRNGLEFVSTMEAHDYPIYGVQWHPEKNIFEWDTRKDDKIPHSHGAIAVGQHVAKFLVNEARNSNHKFASEDEEFKHLVYNYQPVYTTMFEQVYFVDV